MQQMSARVIENASADPFTKVYAWGNNSYFLKSSVNSLYKFRIADTVTDANKVVNNIDATEIISKVAVGLSQFYNRLQSK